MIKYIFYFILVAIFQIISVNNVIAQADSVFLRLQSGGMVPFKYNSIYQYSEGVEYPDWTTFRIDTLSNGVTKTWDLEFKALSYDGTNYGIRGDFTTNVLNLDHITVSATGSGFGAGTFGSEISLSQTYTELITGAQGEGTIYISYACDSLLGEPSDYYFVDIIYRVTEY